MAKKTIIITLHISELLYDVYNKTYLTGRSRQAGDNFKDVANMQADDDEENKNQILRSFGNAISYLYTILSEYINNDSCGIDSNALLSAEDRDIILNMPSNFNDMAAKTIASAMHQYLTNTAMGDWFLITNKADSAEYITQAAANINEIQEAMSQRSRPLRVHF